MGLHERLQWGIGTMPITGTPVNISYWIYTNTLPSAAAVGSSYLASRYVVSPAVYRAVAWASNATSHPVSAQFISKRMTEFTQFKMLKMLGFKEGVPHKELRRVLDLSPGGWKRGMGATGPIQRYAWYETGSGAMRWSPGPILRSLGYAWLAYETYRFVTETEQARRSRGDKVLTTGGLPKSR